jgi:DNA-binding GntR family transcriptional regulator
MAKPSRPKTRQKQAHPIPNSTVLDLLRRAIGSNVRDLLLFDLAIETGVHASQLLTLRVKDLAGLEIGEEISLLSSKLNRAEPVTMGEYTHGSFQQYLSRQQLAMSDILFKSRKGDGPLTLPSASRLVSSWFNQVGLKEMSGFLTLRKTWELHYRQSGKKKNQEVFSPEPEPGYSANTIQTPTTQERVYKELEHAIVTARIKPGERLVAEKLAKQMGVSRIPIREAIGRLEARNLLIVHPQKGTTVYGLSEEKLKEILEIRLILELAAARKASLVAKKNSVETLNRFNKLYTAAQQANDADKLLSVNRKFHFTIYKAANMPILLSMIQSLWDQASPYYHLMFRQTVFHDPQTGRGYHQRIIDALAANDPEEVSKWLEIDLVESTKFVLGVMRSIKTAEQNI